MTSGDRAMKGNAVGRFWRRAAWKPLMPGNARARTMAAASGNAARPPLAWRTVSTPPVSTTWLLTGARPIRSVLRLLPMSTASVGPHADAPGAADLQPARRADCDDDILVGPLTVVETRLAPLAISA